MEEFGELSDEFGLVEENLGLSDTFSLSVGEHAESEKSDDEEGLTIGRVGRGECFADSKLL
jgi:hypothetical protein